MKETSNVTNVYGPWPPDQTGVWQPPWPMTVHTGATDIERIAAERVVEQALRAADDGKNALAVELLLAALAIVGVTVEKERD